MNDKFIGKAANCSFCGKNVTMTNTVQYAMASGEKGKTIKGLHVGSNAFCDLACFSMYKQTGLKG